MEGKAVFVDNKNGSLLFFPGTCSMLSSITVNIYAILKTCKKCKDSDDIFGAENKNFRFNFNLSGPWSSSQKLV